jgi:hypothetical protein
MNDIADNVQMKLEPEFDAAVVDAGVEHERLLKYIRKLERQIAAQSVAVAAKIHPSKPNKFDGSKRQFASAWLHSMDGFFLAAGILDDATRLQHVSTYLQDSAQIWWMSLQSHVPTWKVFINAFNANYQPLDVQKKASHSLRNLSQRASVEKYCEVFRQEKLLVDPDMFPEKLLIELFIDGLKNDIKLQMIQTKRISLEEVMAESQRVDRIIWDIRGSGQNNGSFRPPPFQRAGAGAGSASNPIHVNAVDGSHTADVELAAITMPWPAKLTDAERDKCRKEGRCFKCRKPGHQSGACTVEFVPKKW